VVRLHPWMCDLVPQTLRLALACGILLRQAHVLAYIPGILVHERLDLGSPLVTAWELAQAWPNSELVIVSGAGHASTDPGMSEALIAATDRFVTRR
jgi:proline iminopeptidase